jgi:predicted HAD superfamily Cof-like phosphohydrolase
MEDYIKDVKTFQEKFDLNYFPTDESARRDAILMRANFLLEEVDELAYAMGLITSSSRYCRLFKKGPIEVNHAEALDALVDLAYVLFGTVNLLGYAEIFDLAWKRVHEANLKKVRATSKTKRGTTFDVVKPVGWEPPNLEDLI